MAYVTCAISGVLFETSHFLNLRLPASEGYPHPIFAANSNYLATLYTAHSRGSLTTADSYLLFMAYLHSSGKIDWRHPATVPCSSDASKKLVENSLSQLISVLARTEQIRHPKFKQPRFIVTHENASLEQIPNWIKAWDDNIEYFFSNEASIQERNSIAIIEKELTKLILGGDSPESYAKVIANWADKASEFPAHKVELYKTTISSCFNITKMFNTPLPLLKAYCEENIEVGSLHYKALMDAINSGITKHIDYLGGSTLSLGYTLLTTLGESDGKLIPLHSTKSESLALSKEQMIESEAKLKSLIATAPLYAPVAKNYKTSGEFLKAKLAYRVASNAASSAAKLKAQLDKEGL
jgi:hypothetical protein